MKMKRTVPAVLLALALATSACGGDDSASGDLQEMTFALTTASMAPKEEVAILAVGQQMGYYAEEGIDLEVVTADGSSAAAQAVASGSADVSSPDAGSLLAAAGKGVGLNAIGGVVENWPWSIAVLEDSKITEASDLKGRNVGVISLASGSAPYARAFLDEAGVGAKNAELIPVGVAAQATSALKGGDADALALFGQAYEAIEQNGVKLRYLENPDFFDNIRSMVFVADQKRIAKDPGLFEGFLRASYKALYFSMNNPEAAVRMGYAEFPQLLAGAKADDKVSKDVKLLTRWLESATPAGDDLAQATWGAISDEDWTATQQYSIKAGQITEEIDLAKVWNDDLLEAGNDFDREAVATDAEKFDAANLD